MTDIPVFDAEPPHCVAVLDHWRTFERFVATIAPNARTLTAHPSLRTLVLTQPNFRNPPPTLMGINVTFDRAMPRNTGRLNTPSYVSMAGAGPSIVATKATTSPPVWVLFRVVNL